ncbi:DUF2958 domain-containing protein [Limimaricola hongkongensis]|uniref:DUF2958 domain-containing protein n=1 Tax=Limimaricola hongkongensis TaxID=278132 RepID=UPI000374026B|nr:DUF2958 domain-containing protein [Limimaricola hongkongensis]
MELLTEEQRAILTANGKSNEEQALHGKTCDFKPVVKLFLREPYEAWLLTELIPSDPNDFYGLYLADGKEPDFRYVSLSALEAKRGRGGCTVERDIHFTADKTLQGYAEEARRKGRIIT